MSTSHRSRPAVSAFVGVLIFALAAPLAVDAEDEVIVSQEPVLDPVPGPSSTTQVPGDVRWVSARVIAPGASVETMRVTAAQHALQSRDLGSLQEEAFAAMLAVSIAPDKAIDDGALASTRAELLAQFRGVELSSSNTLQADQQLASYAVAN